MQEKLTRRRETKAVGVNRPVDFQEVQGQGAEGEG